MQIEHLQLALIGLAIVLVVLLAFAFRSRLSIPALPRPALPSMPRLSKSSKKQAEPEVQLSSERLARLRQEPAAPPDAALAEGKCEQVTLLDLDTVEPRLEEAFNLFEAGTIDMAGYQMRLEAIDTAVRECESGGNSPDPGQLSRAREAVDWCKRWAADFNQSAGGGEHG